MTNGELKDRLVEFGQKAGRDLRLIHGRIDGELATAEKANLAAAINEVAIRIPVNVSVGISPPSNPIVNDLWVDTGA